MKRNALYLLILLFSLGCEKNTEPPAEDSLSKNEKKWEAFDFENYSFTLQITCFCIVDYTLPKTIVVRDNAVVSIGGRPFAELNDVSYRTIDEFFDYIRERQKENPVVETLDFDETYGYPSYIYFDISEMIADEEIGYTLSDFNPE